MFKKNEQDNLSSSENKALKMLSDEYDNLTDEEIRKRIEKNNLLEVKYEE